MSAQAKKTQLQQLTKFLLSSLSPVVKADNIDAWQEQGTLIMNGDDKGNGCYQVAKWKYEAVVTIEDFPHRKIDPYNILAMVAAFLSDSDWPRDEYELTDPNIVVDVISSDNATVLIEVMLIDDIDLVPHAKGPILFNGQRFNVSLASMCIAEIATVNVSVDVKGEA